jgi:hypothetical protein
MSKLELTDEPSPPANLDALDFKQSYLKVCHDGSVVTLSPPAANSVPQKKEKRLTEEALWSPAHEAK